MSETIQIQKFNATDLSCEFDCGFLSLWQRVQLAVASLLGKNVKLSGRAVLGISASSLVKA